MLPFRAQVIAINADIEKAFYQISVDDNDGNYLDFYAWTIYLLINQQSLGTDLLGLYLALLVPHFL